MGGSLVITPAAASSAAVITSGTLGTDTSFTGNILALTSITLNTRARISCGSALARNGAVTLDTNTITASGGDCTTTAETTPGATPVPEPASMALFAGLLVGGRIGPSVVRRAPVRPLQVVIGVAALALAMVLAVEAYG